MQICWLWKLIQNKTPYIFTYVEIIKKIPLPGFKTREPFYNGKNTNNNDKTKT